MNIVTLSNNELLHLIEFDILFGEQSFDIQLHNWMQHSTNKRTRIRAPISNVNFFWRFSADCDRHLLDNLCSSDSNSDLFNYLCVVSSVTAVLFFNDFSCILYTELGCNFKRLHLTSVNLLIIKRK